MSHPENIEDTLESIAKRKLGINTLKTRNSDRLDFHDVSVGAIKEALLTAYTAGLNAKALEIGNSALVIYSPNESAASDGGGFWSNDHGWGSLDNATVFTQKEADSLNLPIATGDDARWTNLLQAHQAYGTTDTPPARSPSP